MSILFPLVYAMCGFVFSAIGTWIYNIIAAQIGGFEFTTEEVSVTSM